MQKKKLILQAGELQIFTLKQLSEHFDIHVKTLRRYIKEGKLKAAKIGRKYVISSSNLKSFVDGEN